MIEEALGRQAMMSLPDSLSDGDTVPGGGRFAENIMHFGRALRAAGLPVGPGKVLDAVRAVQTAGLQHRKDFYWTLHSVFVNRRDQREIFDQAFAIFWRNPELLEKMMSLMLPEGLLALRGQGLRHPPHGLLAVRLIQLLDIGMHLRQHQRHHRCS